MDSKNLATQSEFSKSNERHFPVRLDLFGFYYLGSISEERPAQNVTVSPQQWPQHASSCFLDIAQWETIHSFLGVWNWGSGVVDRLLGCSQETELSGGRVGVGWGLSTHPMGLGTMGHLLHELLYQIKEGPLPEFRQAH